VRKILDAFTAGDNILGVEVFAPKNAPRVVIGEIMVEHDRGVVIVTDSLWLNYKVNLPHVERLLLEPTQQDTHSVFDILTYCILADIYFCECSLCRSSNSDSQPVIVEHHVPLLGSQNSESLLDARLKSILEAQAFFKR